MIAYRAKVKLKDLKSAVSIPSEINSPEVEIIVISETSRNDDLVKKSSGKKVSGKRDAKKILMIDTIGIDTTLWKFQRERIYEEYIC